MTPQEKIMSAGKALYMLQVSNVEIARTLDVSDTTVSNWVTKGGWREERSDVQSRKKARMDMLGDLIDYQLEALTQRMSRSRDNALLVALQEEVIHAARALYMLDIANADITETLSLDDDDLDSWIKERGWRSMRDNKDAHQRGVLLPLDKGEIDALAKMFAQIKGKELTFDNLVNLVRELMEFLNQRVPDLAKALVPYTTDFILSKKEVLGA